MAGFKPFSIVFLVLASVFQNEVTVKAQKEDPCGPRGICRCHSEFKTKIFYVDCSWKKLIQVPTGIPANVSKLYLRHDEFTKLEEESFQYMLILEELDISNNKLLDLPEYLLCNNSKLIKLDLERNKLTTLPSRLLRHSYELKDLDISYNQLEYLPEYLLKNTTKLKMLRLQNNRIKYFGQDFFRELKYLHQMDISNNKLFDLPEYLLRNNSKLVKLNLEKNKLTTLPSHFLRHSYGLEKFDISYNRLEYLPEYLLKNTTKLKMILLHHNCIIYFGKDFFRELKNLHWLDISNNELLDIPEYLLRNNSKLFSLSLAGNKLTTLPSHLLRYSYGLGELDISDNQLEYLPEYLLKNTTKLSVLLLHNNRIKYIGKDFFRELKYLYRLDLTDNLLTNMTVDFLSFSNMLRNLSLSGNKLTTVPSHLLRQSYALQELYLGGNHIKLLSPGSFVNNPHLEKLDLTNNNMKIESPRVLSCLANVQKLYLSGNTIENISDESFHSFFDTRILELNNISITNIPDLLFSSMEMLQKLSIEKNSIAEIRQSHFASLHNLDILYLGWNRIHRIEKDSFLNLGKLDQLRLSHNNITCLPERIFTGTPILRLLDLSSNMISDVHNGLFNSLPRLSVLKMTGNALTHLPENIFSASKDFMHLALDDNFLQELPNGLLRNLNKLSQLKLSQNELRCLQSNTFDGMWNLLYLFLSFNNISKLPWDLFAHAELTSTLDLSNNRLTSLPNGLFNSNKKNHRLNTLLLHRNQIEYLGRDVFRGLPILKSLCLIHNNIKVLGDDAFAGISGKIYLFGNKISIMNTTAFRNRNITEIHLYGNNIGLFNKTTFCGLSSKTTLFIDCQEVQKLQQPAVDVTCVTPQFRPVLLVDGKLFDTMGREGFNCTPPQSQNDIFCSPCPRGTFSNGSNECVPCPPGGFYQDELGITYNEEICKACSNGTFVKSGGGKSIGDCTICPDGTNKKIHAGYRACFCLDKYARKERLGPCYLCDDKGVNCSGRDFESIKPGFYWSWDFEGANLTNYRKLVTNLAIENRSVDFNVTYDGEIPRTFACARRENCKNTVGGVDVQCATGYTGWLCSKCMTGFYSVMNYCLHCPEKEWLFIEVALILCFCVVVSACVFRFYKLDKRRKTSERSLLDISISRGKIALGFYQVAGELFTSLHDVTLTTTMKFIGDVISVIELNILRLFIRPQCFYDKLQLNPKNEFVIAMTFIISVIIGSVGIYQIIRIIRRCKTKYTDASKSFEENTKDLKSKLSTCCIITLFVTYPPVCTIVFQLYPRACETFFLDRAGNTCKVLLRSDYDIECQDLNLYHIFAYAATVGYVVAYPAVLLILLYRRFQFSSLKSAKIPQDSSKEDNQLLADDTTREGSNPVWVNFLCENYKLQYWYWEIVELARKVTQTVLIVLLGWENKLTVLITIGISVTFLTLHARYMPMKSVFEQRLQMFSLVAILFNVLIAAMDVPHEYGDAFSVVIITLNSAVIVIIGAEVAFGLFVRLTHIRINEVANRFSHHISGYLKKRPRSDSDE